MSQSESIGFEVRELSLLIARYIEKMSNGGHIRGPQGFALGYLVHNRDKKFIKKIWKKNYRFGSQPPVI